MGPRKFRTALGIAAALLLVLAGIGALAPNGARAATPFNFTDNDCTSANMSTLVSSLASAVSSGQSVAYTGVAPCTVELNGTTLQPPGGSAITIDGGIGLTLNEQNNGNDVLSIMGTSGNSLTLNHVTLENGDEGINADSTSGVTINLTNSTISHNSFEGIDVDSTSGLTLNVTSSTISNNSAVGIFGNNASGAIAVSNSTISGNSSNGIYVDGATNLTLTVTSSTIRDNSGDEIDAISASGSITVINSTLSGDRNGDGLDVNGASATIRVANSTISGNSGDGIDASVTSSPTIWITNSTIDGNASDGIDAGGVNGALTIVDSTISGTTNARGIDTFGGYNGTITVTASIVADNAQGNCFSYFKPVDGGYNISASAAGTDDSCGFSTSTTHSRNATDTQLSLQTLENNGGPTETRALVPSSVAVNAIPLYQGQCTLSAGQSDPIKDASGSPITTDQRGISRPQGAGCDIGAYELSGSATLQTCPDQTALQADLDFAPKDGTAYSITFPNNCTLSLQDHGLTVGAGVNITIVGNGLTVDGQRGSFDIIDVNDSEDRPSTLTLDHVTLQNGANGVVESTGTGTVSLTGSTIQNMSSSNSVIAYGVNAYTVNITGSTISGITNTGAGSAYAVSGSNVTVDSSTIHDIGGEQASAGIFTLNSITVINSTITGITNAGSFGVISLGPGPATVTSSTIANIGMAGQPNSGLGVIDAGGTMTVTASILASNGTNCGGSIGDGGYNLATDTSCGFAPGSTSHVVTASDLNLQPLANNGGPTKTIALGPGSIAIDVIPLNGQGQCVAGTQIDQRGINRPLGPGCDVGAYETANLVSSLPGSTTTVRQGFFALIRIDALSPSGQNISSRNLRVSSVELDGPNGQQIAFVHPFQFGRFGRDSGYQLSINTRNLSRGTWTLVVRVGSDPTLYSTKFEVK